MLFVAFAAAQLWILQSSQCDAVSIRLSCEKRSLWRPAGESMQVAFKIAEKKHALCMCVISLWLVLTLSLHPTLCFNHRAPQASSLPAAPRRTFARIGDVCWYHPNSLIIWAGWKPKPWMQVHLSWLACGVCLLRHTVKCACYIYTPHVWLLLALYDWRLCTEALLGSDVSSSCFDSTIFIPVIIIQQFAIDIFRVRVMVRVWFAFFKKMSKTIMPKCAIL